MPLLFALILISCFTPGQLQESSITISPTSSICAGDTVTITCYAYPSDGVAFKTYAEIFLYSFLRAFTDNIFTINSNVSGYSVTGDIPVKGNSARLQITISNYLTANLFNSIDCYGLSANNNSIYRVASSGTPPIAVLPSSPTDTSISTAPRSAAHCHSFILSWSPPDDSNAIDRYHVYRDIHSIDSVRREYVSTTTTTQYIITDQLNISNTYKYSVIASNCIGNSTTSEDMFISFEVSIDNLTLSYDPSNKVLAVHWGLCYDTFPGNIRYSLSLMYNLTNGDAFQDPMDLCIITHPTTQPSYYTKLNLTVGSDISVCMNVMEQCGQKILQSRYTKTCASYAIPITPASIVTLHTYSANSTNSTNSTNYTDYTDYTNLGSISVPTLVLSFLFVLACTISLLSVLVIFLLFSIIVKMKRKVKKNEKTFPGIEFL